VVHGGHIHNLLKDMPLGLQNVVMDRAPFLRTWDRNFKVTIDDGKDPCERKDWNVYTDGSRIDGRSGSGAALYYNKEYLCNISANLGEATVYQAEPRVISMACDLLSSSSSNITFLVDNQASLKALKGLDSRQSIVQEVLAKLNKLGSLREETHRSIELRWIKAHAKWIGNEEADKAAKPGAQSKHSGGSIPLAICGAKSQMWIKTNKDWQE
jgi:ribonuclease HI